MVADITQEWGLSFDDLSLLAGLPRSVRLEAALQLCYLRRIGQYIEDWSCISEDVLSYVASQVGTPGIRPVRAFDNRTARLRFPTASGRAFRFDPAIDSGASGPPSEGALTTVLR